MVRWSTTSDSKSQNLKIKIFLGAVRCFFGHDRNHFPFSSSLQHYHTRILHNQGRTIKAETVVIISIAASSFDHELQALPRKAKRPSKRSYSRRYPTGCGQRHCEVDQNLGSHWPGRGGEKEGQNVSVEHSRLS